MNLRHSIDMFKRRMIAIVIVATLAVTVVVAAGLLTTPVYTANATVRVIQNVGITDLRVGDAYSERLMNTYGLILRSWPILEEAAERLGSSRPAASLWDEVSIEAIPDTELMAITVQDRDPAFAALFANTLAELLVEHTRSLYQGSVKSTRQIVEEQLASTENDLEGDRQQLIALLAEGKVGAEVEMLKSQIKFREEAYNQLLDRYELARLNEALIANSITVVAPAKLPRTPSNSLGLKEVGLSLVMGLFSGIGLALVLENLDTRVHSSQQLEHMTHLPVLGIVPRGLLSLGGSERSNGAGSRPIEEAYRLLGTNLQSLREDVPLQNVLITSAIAKEGKSTVAANLAQTLAERGQTIFLLESDLRHPSMEKMFSLDNDLGLSSLLAGRTSLDDVVLSKALCCAEQPSLFVIGSGPRPANPTALLASPPVAELLDYLSAQGQMTLLDAPPVLGVADVSVLAPRVDGVILVVRQAWSKREQVLAALRQLQASRARVLGFIFLQDSGKGWGY